MGASAQLDPPGFDDPRVAAALDLLPVGVALWGADGRPRAVNRAGAELWGVARLAEAGLAPPRVAQLDSGEEVEHPARELPRGECPEGEHHLLVIRPDGELVPIRSRLHACRDAAGAITAVVDTFERAEPSSSPDRWRRSYDEVADALPFIMWNADAEGRTTSCNRRFWDYAGLSRGGARPDWSQVVHFDDRQRGRELWNQAVAAGSAFRCELRLRRFDGSHHWFLVKAWPVRGRGGEVANWLGTCVNIDELKRLELELRRCNEELASFASVASHDLQEPLRMVASFLDLLRRRAGGSLDVASLEYLAYAHDGARRMQELIRKLLDYSRIGRSPIPGAPIDATVVAREAVINLDRAISESGGSVRIPALPAVRVERVQLMQLLQNLIANALKYRSAQPPVVTLDARREGAEWRFSVRDNGLGIAPEDQQRIFGLFQRGHDGVDHPGSGIGLAVCKKIVENHGGRIWVESEPGMGSCFHFTLPVA
jgi:PAS domain S-box-containing protein